MWPFASVHKSAIHVAAVSQTDARNSNLSVAGVDVPTYAFLSSSSRIDCSCSRKTARRLLNAAPVRATGLS
jgi:hypothetical protein